MSAAALSMTTSPTAAPRSASVQADPPMLASGVRITFSPNDTLRDEVGVICGDAIEGIVLYACQNHILVERYEFDGDTGAQVAVARFVPLRAIRTIEGIWVTSGARIRLLVMLHEVRT